MHPKALLDACAALVQQVLLLQHPADSVVSRFFRQNRSLGPRERATLAETAYTVLRHKLRFEALARSGSGARERRLAILGFAGPRNLLEAALNPAEKTWLKECDAVPEAELLPQHRHNLPQWLAEALQAQLGEQFDALAASLLAPAPLDLRVNTLNAKREAVIKELAAAAAGQGLKAQLVAQHGVGGFGQRGAFARAQAAVLPKKARDHAVGWVLKQQHLLHQGGAGIKKGFGMHNSSKISND